MMRCVSDCCDTVKGCYYGDELGSVTNIHK